MSENENAYRLLPVLALRGLTVFPDMSISFDVGRQKSIKALEEAIRKDRVIFLVTQKDVMMDEPKNEDLYTMGTIARVNQILKIPGDGVRVMVEGIMRGKLGRILREKPYLVAEITAVASSHSTRISPKTEAKIRRCVDLFEEYIGLSPAGSADMVMDIITSRDPGYVADYVAQNTAISFESKQEILQEMRPVARLDKAIKILSREIEIMGIEHTLQSRVQDQMVRHQKDYILREQLKAIQAELGEGGVMEEDEELKEYREKILALKLEESSQQRLLKEVDRLAKQPFGSTEASVIRNYLDTCLELPWNSFSEEVVDIKKAEKVLNDDHYGLEKVKERILEFIAVKQLAPDIKGQIICLVGPPGVGKTSIAISIARALNRKLARMSLGGVRDEADIRGHRKTYVGSMPGRIINAMRQCGSSNPLMLLDEIDKLGNDFRGDPASALLEVLDPEQNAAFRDHYLEIPYDLSRVMFVTTANTTSTIPPALLDRMEVIELSSYTDEEKLRIAKAHLIPKEMKRHGIGRNDLRITDDAVRHIISGYTRESGVRNLQREIASVCRRAAKKTADGYEGRQSVTVRNLSDYLGVEKFTPERRVNRNEIGVVKGLAWTRVGGEILEVEVNVVDGSGKLQLTGNLGDVMKESAQAAMTYIRSRADQLGIDGNFHSKKDIHIHFPEGAVPKDGPSAGIAITCAIVSALTGAPVRRDVAMTGEITLRGRVLAIGGLKEKTMAALRGGVKTVIIPAENEHNLEQIDPNVRKALNFVTVTNADAVINTALIMSERTISAPVLSDAAVLPVPAPVKGKDRAAVQ
ncbi:MAG: endopeptidase La [Oscillospiraceae bacterium]|nr:endopeptidase La [Oscillospiraceae bacterium]